MKPTNSLFLFLAIFLTASCVKRDAPKPTAPPPASATTIPDQTKNICWIETGRLAAELEKKIGDYFEVKPYSKPGEVTVTRTYIAADGQRITENTQTMHAELAGTMCVLKAAEVSRGTLNERRTIDLETGDGFFFRDDELIFSESPLREGAWWKGYEAEEYIGEVSRPTGRIGPTSEWHVSERDVTTWIVTGKDSTGELASRMPVWALEGIWMMGADHKPVLLAGRVTLRNPIEVHTEAFPYVIRLDKRDSVSPNGILYPVSEETYANYLAYQQKQAENWTREIGADQDALLEAIKTFHDNKALGKFAPKFGKETPVKTVWKALEKAARPAPETKKGYMPDFLETGPLF